MAYSAAEKLIAEAALVFAQANKKPIAKRLTDPRVYLPEESPVSVFMAGSPGAGKTEEIPGYSSLQCRFWWKKYTTWP